MFVIWILTVNKVYCLIIDTLDVSEAVFCAFSRKTKLLTLWHVIQLILTTGPKIGRIKVAAVLRCYIIKNVEILYISTLSCR
jgi:hypothetical protein